MQGYLFALSLRIAVLRLQLPCFLLPRLCLPFRNSSAWSPGGWTDTEDSLRLRIRIGPSEEERAANKCDTRGSYDLRTARNGYARHFLHIDIVVKHGNTIIPEHGRRVHDDHAMGTSSSSPQIQHDGENQLDEVERLAKHKAGRLRMGSLPGLVGGRVAPPEKVGVASSVGVGVGPG
ncbi:hypothetical protein THAOC_08228, partial [Thalassiosira oceanica]